jgi:hypothetical protein
VCTVSVVPVGDGFRVACNRDERRTRPIALPPRIRRVEGRPTLWPCDPQSGGTWIGVNDIGLTMALLNRRVNAASPPAPTLSRGTLIPQLLCAGSLDSAVALATAAVEPSGKTRRFEPFTLLMLHRRRAVVVEHHAAGTEIDERSLERPLLFTSSSLGDHLVDEPRRRLFAALLEATPRHVDAQTRFHRHRWPDRPQVSVCMTRPDAMTVSHTVVDVTTGKVTVGYAARWDSCSSHSC